MCATYDSFVMASMAATSKMGLQYSENLCETKLKKNVGLAKKVLKVEYYCSPMIRKENMLRRNLSVVANSSGDMINGKMLHVIHVGDDPYVGKKISSTDACMLGKFVEGRLLAEHVHHVVQHFMMWYSTLTTSSTIPFPLRLRSITATAHAWWQKQCGMMEAMVIKIWKMDHARATWYDGSQDYIDMKNGPELVFYIFLSSEKTPSKK